MAYSPKDKMISLIADNYSLLQVMSRFGIPVGFGDKTVEEVCTDNGVDCKTFLAVVNFISGDCDSSCQVADLSLNSLLHYLKQSHIYFLEFYLPSIRRKLLDGIRLRESDVSFLILKLFDEYVDSVREHMIEEENHLFKFVADAANGKPVSNSTIPVYSHHHESVGATLKELKNIIIKYCPSDAKVNLLNAALYDIYRCEDELASHCRIEDFLLLPALINKTVSVND